MHEFENKSKMSLVLCGSYMDIMMKAFNRNGPLYGRFNEIIHLKPFDKESVSTVSSKPIKEENTNTVFELIALGKKYYNELNQGLGNASKDNATRYLQRLEEMDLIGKVIR